MFSQRHLAPTEGASELDAPSFRLHRCPPCGKLDMPSRLSLLPSFAASPSRRDDLSLIEPYYSFNRALDILGFPWLQRPCVTKLPEALSIARSAPLQAASSPFWKPSGQISRSAPESNASTPEPSFDSKNLPSLDGQISFSCQVYLEKIFRLPRRANQRYQLAPSHPTRGALAIVTKRGAGCGGRGWAFDERP